MKHEKIKQSELKLVGITTRTNNANESNPTTAKIGPMVQTYFSNQLAEQIKNRLHPGVTYSVYTDYVSDEHGDYTYFLGEVVTAEDDQDNPTLTTLIIPEGEYQKFTIGPGLMPNIVIESWQKIWKMTPKDFDGKRRYLADFEVYDQRAADFSNAIVDIYIGIE